MAKIGEIFIKTITNIILTILTIAVLIMLYSFISLSLLKKDYVNFWGYTAFEVASGSMAETINIDDLVIVKVNAKYKVGDIITYKHENDFITHRIIKIDSQTKLITAKGDANNVEDNNINPNQVVGKVIKIIPDLGVWKKVLMTPKVLILAFLTLVLFNFAFAYNKKGPKKEKITKKEQNIDLKENIVKEKIITKDKKEKVKKPKVKQPFRK